MNLVLSGPIDDTLRHAVAALVCARAAVLLHAQAVRYESADDAPSIRLQVAQHCDTARVDHAWIEEGKRFCDFKLLAMDMDSTLITIECIDEIADYVGKKKEIAAITEAAMRGEIPDFAESLRRRVALLAGTPESVLAQVFDKRLRLSPGANELLAAANHSGIFTLLVSGGFTYFTDRLKHALALDAAYANTLVVSNGLLTGQVTEPILDAQAKARHVRDTIDRLRIDPTQAIVIGDGANDIPMMGEVTYSVAYMAKQATARIAAVAIKHTGLASVLAFFA